MDSQERFLLLPVGTVLVASDAYYPHPKRPYRVVRRTSYGFQLRAPGLKRPVKATWHSNWQVAQ